MQRAECFGVEEPSELSLVQATHKNNIPHTFQKLELEGTETIYMELGALRKSVIDCKYGSLWGG